MYSLDENLEAEPSYPGFTRHTLFKPQALWVCVCLPV